jgi:diguanylate cyclase (GGDEF)-like protein
VTRQLVVVSSAPRRRDRLVQEIRALCPRDRVRGVDPAGAGTEATDPPASCLLVDLVGGGAAQLDALETLVATIPAAPIVALARAPTGRLVVRSVGLGAHDCLQTDPAIEAAGLRRSVTLAVHRHRSMQRLLWRALHDPVTALPGRMLFLDRFEHALAAGRRRADAAIAVVFIDLDGFKTINDMHGHDIGDSVLHAVAQRTSRALRPADSVARYGGDEFTVLCEDLTAAGDVVRITERVLEAVAEPMHIGDLWLKIRVSAGIAFATARDRPARELLRLADEAMYMAKRKGGGLVVHPRGTPSDGSEVRT